MILSISRAAAKGEKEEGGVAAPYGHALDNLTKQSAPRVAFTGGGAWEGLLSRLQPV